MPETVVPVALIRKILDFPIPLIPLTFFFNSASLALGTGQSIPDALMSASDVGDPELRQMFIDIAPALRRGAALSQCMRQYEERFPEIVMPLIDVGEASGGLPAQAKRLAETFKMQVDADRQQRYNVYDPKLIFAALSVLAVAVIWILSYLMPDAKLPAWRMALQRSTGVIAVDIAVVLLVVGGCRIARLLYRWFPLRLFVDNIKLAIPGFGQVSRNLSAARWARSFATLWSAGVNISKALEISSRSALNAHYERLLLTAAEGTRSGTPLSVCLARAQLLPPNLISIIQTCEQIGRLDENLERFAADMEREALARGIEEMNKFVLRAQLIFYLIMAAVMLTIAASGGA